MIEFFEGPTIMSEFKILDPTNPVGFCNYHSGRMLIMWSWNQLAEHMAEEHPDILIQLLEFETDMELKSLEFWESVGNNI